ncbi:glycosyltransferase family 2 protein [Proteinivorax hydrogeniformans]|uniref:Glycosyltransferase family 2 protein n=1 Tax=Proteinivorax hydrogeniformans TaxID=1826727 RepID=A0AAU8HUM4_9FIRM
MGMNELIKTIIHHYSIGMLIYFLMVNLFYITIIILSLDRLKKFLKISGTDITAVSDYTKPISILVPAYNERETIIDSIQSLLDLDYPKFEIIVVNDGSKDDTLQRVISFYNLRRVNVELNNQVPSEHVRGVYSSFDRPNLVVVDKENGGKADALNAGINVSRFPLFCAIDADSFIEKKALIKVAKPFQKYSETIASGGIVRIANGCKIENGQLVKASLPKKMVEKFQVIEYFRAFLTSRVGWESLNSLLIISGAFGLFKKSAVIKVGGYKKTIGEDMELILRLHKEYIKEKIPYKISFASDAVCWTQAPDSLKGLKSQRLRWHRGLIDSMLKHKELLFNPRYGKVGMLSMPYFCLVEMLGPVIELVGYIILGLAIYYSVLSNVVLYIFLVAFLFGVLFSYSGILLEQLSYKRYNSLVEICLLFLYSLFEQVGYRQITVWWRFLAFLNFKKGSKQWGSIQRKSFTKGG